MKVLVYDDSSARQEALKLLLNHDAGIELVGSFVNCNNVVEEVDRLRPDVVLMDVDMPGVNGIAGLKLIRQHFPEVMIVMQTVFEDESTIFDAIYSGAHGYFLKSTPPERLLQGLRDVLEGGAPMTPLVAQKVLQKFRTKPSDAVASPICLTEREIEVINMLSKGLSYKMIAKSLDISYHTVNGHIKQIYEKLHVNSATAAVMKAINQKIIQ